MYPFDPFLVIATIKFFALGALLAAFFGPRGRVIGFGFLIPLAAAAVSALMKKKSGDKKAQAAKATAQSEWQTAEDAKRAAWEEKYGSPQAEAGRTRATMQLGRLLAATGGRAKAPVSLVKNYEALRARPTYTAGVYHAGGDPGAGGGWWFAGDLVNAAGEAAQQYAAEKAKEKSD
jgi:hypothetical protein